MRRSWRKKKIVRECVRGRECERLKRRRDSMRTRERTREKGVNNGLKEKMSVPL